MKNRLTWRPLLISTGLGLGMLGSIVVPNRPVLGQTGTTKSEQQISTEEAQLDTSAVKAQNDGKFSEAAAVWNRLLTDYPNSVLSTKALHQVALCEVKLGKYEDAAKHFQTAIQKTKPDEIETLARAQLFLGYSRLRLGESALADGDETKANQYLTSAAEALAVVTDKYSNFEGAHEAAYFRGSAFEQLGQLENAITAYSKVLAFDNPRFRADTLYALGDLNFRTKKHSAAAEYLSEFLTKFADQPVALDVRFLAARNDWQLAQQATEAGNAARHDQLASAAEQNFEILAKSESPKATEARFELALIQYQLKKLPESQKNFQLIAENPASELRGLAATNLGRQLSTSGKFDEALPWFQVAIDTNDTNSAAAVHWKAQALLSAKKYQETVDLVGPWITKLPPEDQRRFELMLDRADATMAIPDQQKNAVELYLELSKSTWSGAPIALYNAAFSALELGDAKRASVLSKQFTDAHPQHEFVPDAIEISAEAALADSDYGSAKQNFVRLLKDFPQHSKHEKWVVRSALTSFLNNEPQTVIAELTPAIATLQDKVQLAEAWHWLGSSNTKLSKFDDAIKQFQNSLAAGVWTKRSETMLGLAEAQIGKADWTGAETTIESLVGDFAKSPAAARGLYLLGEHFKQSNQADKASQVFARIAQMETAGAFGNYAAMKQGWLKIDQKDWSGAQADFERAIAAAGDDQALLNKSRIGLATALRNSERIPVAVETLKKVLTDSQDELIRIDAQYELGLAYASEKKWSDATTQFEGLLDRKGAGEIEPNVRYELAWALMNTEHGDQAQTHFQWLAENAADTSLGADALFQLGEAEYAKQEFKRALEHFQKCLAAAPESLQEKAYYRMGWAQFRLGDFAQSNECFLTQTGKFAKGPLYADGLYMLSETSFKQKDFEQALAHYRTAKPIIDSSATIDKVNVWLSRLHAAQSANILKRFDEAREFAKSLVDDANVDAGLRLDAQLELGLAFQGLNDVKNAVEAWTVAAKNDMGKTGIHARCMLGEASFAKKEFEKAILEFTLAKNGYGGTEVEPEIDRWQAFATFEMARCKYVQSQTMTSEESKRKLIGEAITEFESLVKEFPNDTLVPDARKQIDTLKQYLGKKP